MNSQYNVVAEVVRVEFDKARDEVFLVFKIIDEKFKQDIKKDWTKDVDLQLINNNLYKVE